MKLLLLAGYLVFMIVIQVRTELVQAGTRLPFLINSQDLEAFEYVTITGNLIKLPHLVHLGFHFHLNWILSPTWERNLPARSCIHPLRVVMKRTRCHVTRETEVYVICYIIDGYMHHRIYMLKVIFISIIFLQDATTTATRPVAIAISANSLHYVCYVVEKTLDLM